MYGAAGRLDYAAMSHRAVAGTLLAAGLLACLAGKAHAQGVSSAASCPAGNLLAAKAPWQWIDIRGQLPLVTDGNVAPEGAIWNAPLAIQLDTPAATITYELPQLTTLNAVYIQGDANDTYQVWGSPDGREWKALGRIEPVDGHGLRGRSLFVGGVPVKYLRVGEGIGDNFYSIAEIQAFCQVPQPFPPKLNVVAAPPAAVDERPFWNNDTSSRWELILAVIGGAFLLWSFLAKRSGGGRRHRLLRDLGLGALGVISFLTYFNFGSFHFPNYIHGWDTFHYYVGSKYFRELGYDKLYDCVAVADAEDPLLRRRVELRKITDLRTNELVTTESILKHPERCKATFSAPRWQSFKKDLTYFRTLETPKRWDEAQTDHGYNGTPVWNIAGSLLANTGQASKSQVMALNLLDPAYLIAACAVIWWAFGWRILCVALLVFATNFPSRFYWTGGAFLRWDWLFYLVASVCLLKKDRPLLAGLALGYATLLRVFPGFMFVGPIIAALVVLFRERRVHPTYLRFFVGAALAVALLVPLSMTVAGGPQVYKNFVQNTIKHKETPLTNYMGLRTVMAYRPGEAGKDLRSDQLHEPWSKWKEARLRGWKEAKPVYALIVVGFLVILGFAVKGVEPWIAAALSATFIAVGVELTCYYYAFIMAVALLHREDERVGITLCALTAFTGFVDWAPFRGMPRWLDEQYTLMSVATVIAFAVIVWDFGVARRLGARSAPVAAPEDQPAPSALSAATPKKKKRR